MQHAQKVIAYPKLIAMELLRRTVATVALSLIVGPIAWAQQPAPVLQRGYDANVSGVTMSEVALNTTNVSPATFRLLFTLPVDEKISAQPLYVPGVVIAGQGTHNVLYVATMNDTIYAFDADVGGSPLWSLNLAALFDTTAVPWGNFSNPPYMATGNLGILSTPVIDPITHIMYVVASTLENSTMAYRLHAIDITSGSEPYGPGMLITGAYASATFIPTQVVQRMSLALSDNQVVFAFAAMASETPGLYLGWVMAYNEQSLQQSGIFAPVVNGELQGGVWQSGRPPAVDGAGYVYLFSGNTKNGGYDGMSDFSESLLKLDPSNALTLADWFTPDSWSYLDANDLDLSGSGPTLIPGTTLLTGGGKAGELYLLDTTNLQHYTATDSQVVQEQNITAGGQMNGGPVFWNRSVGNGGPVLFDWGSGDVVKAFPFTSGQFATTPSSQGTATMPLPGGILTVSSDGDSNGILWALTPGLPASGGNPAVPAALHAFDATNVATELYNSNTHATDAFGNLARFVPPMVANGKVYVATGSRQLAVYGLVPFTVSPATLAFGNETTYAPSPPQLVTVNNTGNLPLPITSIALTSPGPHPFSQTNNCGTSVPVGSNCTVNVVFNPATLGPRTQTLSINAGGGAGTQTVTVSGTGVGPPYTISPTSLTFGNQQYGTSSSSQPVTVTNNGSSSLPITSVTITGPNSAQFSQMNNCGTSVAAGSNCAVSVVFSPTGTGVKKATLSINAGGGAGTQTAAISGTGVGPPYTVSPTTLAFGSETTNVPSAAQSVTVTNTGTSALPITSVTISGPNTAQFSQNNNCGTSVAIGSNCTINVVFSPTGTGARSATLNVNAGGTDGTQTVKLTGTAAPPPFTVAPTSLAFGSQLHRTSSAPQSVTVTNTGTAALPITSIALSGANAGSFSQGNNCGTSVAVGSNCTINVIFTPAGTGAKSATLSVIAGGSDGTLTVKLSGTGT